MYAHEAFRSPIGASLFLTLIALSPAADASITQQGEVELGESVQVGNTTFGQLTVEAPSAIESNSVTLGQREGSLGVARLVGGVWENSGDTYVGSGGRGVLQLESGATYVNQDIIFIGLGGGADQSSSGVVSVDGLGTSLVASEGGLYVGYDAPGDLSVTGGGFVSTSYTLLGCGHQGSSVGTATVSGEGSLFRTWDLAFAGGPGEVGRLDVLDGGRVVVPGRVSFEQQGGVGELTVSGRGSSLSMSELNVLGNGHSSIIVEGGGTLGTEYIDVGPFGSARFVVSGAGSALLQHGSGSTVIHKNSTNVEILVEDGGFAGLALRKFFGSSSLVVDGQGSLVRLQAQSALLGGYSEDRTTVVVSDGGTLTALGTLSLSNGSIALDRGTIASNGFSSLEFVNGSGGLITGTGNLLTRVENRAGGEIRVGGGDELLIGGDVYNQDGGVFRVTDGRLDVRPDWTGFRNEAGGKVLIDNGWLGVVGNFSYGGVYDNAGETSFTGGASTVSADVTRNSGVMVLLGGSQVSFEGTAENPGRLIVEAGSTASFMDDYRGAGIEGEGSVVFRGEALLDQGPMAYAFGGDVEFAITSTPVVEFSDVGSGPEVTEWVVAGEAELGGTLDLRVFDPIGGGGASVDVEIVDAGALVGQFDVVPEFGEHLGMGVLFGGINYDTGRGVVEVSLEQAGDGDFNLDGATDALDMAVLRSNFGSTSAGFTEGDADFDGDIDVADLLLLQRAMEGSAAAGAPVPEPGAWLLLAALSLSAFGWRGRGLAHALAG